MSELSVESLTLNVEPRNVCYCKVCSMPPEYCEFGNSLNECKTWLKENDTELYAKLYGTETTGEAESAEAAPKPKQSKKKEVAKKIVITIIERTKRKRITQVRGLELFDVELKKAAKQFASKFAASTSVSKIPSGGDEILIQGECAHELVDYILQQFNGISEADITFGETKKKKKDDE